MRLIDADNAPLYLNKSACEQIKKMPTIEAVPVVHGRYVTDDMGDSSCSACGENYIDVTKNYCPNCGAKMDVVNP